MLGVSLLYHLANEGWRDLLLIEKGELTSGSTWHAAGMVPAFILGDINIGRMYVYSNQLYRKLEHMTGQYVSFHGPGGIRLAVNSKELEWCRRAEGYAEPLGVQMEIIGRKKIAELHPYLNLDDVVGGLYSPLCGHVDPAGACNALAIAARNLGAEIMRHNRVAEIKQHRTGEWLVTTEQGDVTAEIVVNAGGCYAKAIGRMVGIDLPIVPLQHQYIVTEDVPEFLEREGEVPLARCSYTNAYYRQEQKALLYGPWEFEGIQQAWPNGGPEWKSEAELFKPDLNRLELHLNRGMERIPMLQKLGIKRVVNGAIPFTPDGNPLLGPAPGLCNFWLCCGAQIGIAQGPGCGKYLAQWMVHGDAEIDMSGFDSRRFGRYALGEYAIAKATEVFSYYLRSPFYGEEKYAGRPKRTSPLYNRLKTQGGIFTEVHGWERPKWFSLDGRTEDYGYSRNNIFEVIGDECRAVRERVGVLDLSSFAKFELTGKDAEPLLRRISANRIPRKSGRIGLVYALSENGRILSEMTIARLSDGHFYIVTGGSAEIRDYWHLRDNAREGEDVTITNRTDELGVLVVAGPRSRQLLSKLTDADLSSPVFPWLSGREITIADVPVRALRITYVGELGWELHHSMDRMAELYNAIWQTGQSFGIVNFGAMAMNCLRMEKAYPAWRHELTNEIGMVEAGLERFVDFHREEWNGRQSTLKKKLQGGTTKLVYLEVDADGADVVGTEPVFSEGKYVGLTSSGGYGYTVQKSLAFAYIEPEYAKPETTFEIRILGQSCGAKMLSQPAYDPTNSRQKA